jgi:hypothetical protein
VAPSKTIFSELLEFAGFSLLELAGISLLLEDSGDTELLEFCVMLLLELIGVSPISGHL